MSASTVQHNVGVNVSVSPVRDVQVRGVWSVAELVRYKLHLDLVIDIVDIVEIVDNVYTRPGARPPRCSSSCR